MILLLYLHDKLKAAYSWEVGLAHSLGRIQPALARVIATNATFCTDFLIGRNIHNL